MAIWRLIETVHNITMVMAYVSVGLWIIAAIVNIIRHRRNKRS
jgi:hypothetical protein